jgi:hypothetical protein
MLLFLKQAFPEKRIIFLTDDLNNNPDVIANIEKLDISVERTHRSIDPATSLILIGGGTLFNTSVFAANEPYIDIAYTLLEKHYHVGFIGTEIVEIQNKTKAHYAFSRAWIHAARNLSSFRYLETEIFDPYEELPQVSVMGDLIEYITLPTKQERIHNRVGICISRKSGIAKNDIAGLVNTILKNGKQVEFFSFSDHLYNPDEHDSDFAREIKTTHFSKNDDVTVCEKKPPTNMIQHISQYEEIITTRLHATIIGKRYGVPVINVSNEAKCVRYCETYGIPRVTELKSVGQMV